jgi:hypothetical protein
MTKNEVSAAGSVGIDLKEFFEASVGALQAEMESTKVSGPIISRPIVRRNCALVQRNPLSGNVRNRAVSDAARALTALWKTQTAKKPV